MKKRDKEGLKDFLAVLKSQPQSSKVFYILNWEASAFSAQPFVCCC